MTINQCVEMIREPNMSMSNQVFSRVRNLQVICHDGSVVLMSKWVGFSQHVDTCCHTLPLHQERLQNSASAADLLRTIDGSLQCWLFANTACPRKHRATTAVCASMDMASLAGREYLELETGKVSIGGLGQQAVAPHTSWADHNGRSSKPTQSCYPSRLPCC